MIIFSSYALYKIYAVFIGYFFGCFQSAFRLGKIFKNTDIRKHGSGNAGATNMTRVFGKKLGLAVFICDMLKSILAYLFCVLLFKDNLAGIYGGLGVILGHDFPFYLKFHGGKGVAPSMGLILIYNWKIALISYSIGVTFLLFTHKVSVGSLFGLLTACFCLSILSINEVFVLFFVICLLGFWQHRKNIIRLLNNKEPDIF